MILFIKHFGIEGGGFFEEFFKKYTSWDVRVVNLEKNEKLPLLDRCKAIISLGGPMNVYETKKYPFLIAEENFLKDALEKKIPTLGICLGAQLLAKILGAKVKKAKKEEFGWFDIELTEAAKDDPLFYNLKSPMSVFEWHEDTFGLPLGSKLLAKGQNCKNQAARFTDYSWGIQFHFEITLRMLRSWCKYYSISFDNERLLTNDAKKWKLYHDKAKVFLLNFCRVIQSR